MKNLLFILTFLVSSLFAISNNELLKPKSEIYDFTFSSSTGSSEDYENNNSIDKIEWEVEKIVGLLPRNNIVSSCNKDSFNTDYCPIELAQCSQEWDYYNGVAEEKTNQGCVKEGTTLIDGNCVGEIACASGSLDTSTGQCKVIGTFGTTSGTAKRQESPWLVPYHFGYPVDTYDDFRSGYSSARRLCQGVSGQLREYGNASKISSITRWDGLVTFQHINPFTARTSYRHNGGWGTAYCTSQRVFKLKCYISQCDEYHKITPKNSGLYIAPKGNYFGTSDQVCKDFGYDYAASSSYGTVKNGTRLRYKSGSSWVTITSPYKSDGGAWNDSYYYKEINCVTIGDCPSGIINGQSFNYQTCQEGFLNDGSQCVRETENNCQSDSIGIDSSGRCIYPKINYKYYEYKCNTTESSQGYTFEVQDKGGDCNPKSNEDLIDLNGDGIKDSCNENNPPANNCKREKYTCESNPSRACAKIGESWQCSPYECNQNNNCGYGYCEDGQESTSAANIIPYPMNPIEALVRSGDACNPVPCTEEYEYDDGTATKNEVKNCFGGTTLNTVTQKCEKQASCPSGKSLVNGQCEGWVYAEKVYKVQTEYLSFDCSPKTLNFSGSHGTLPARLSYGKNGDIATARGRCHSWDNRDIYGRFECKSKQWKYKDGGSTSYYGSVPTSFTSSANSAKTSYRTTGKYDGRCSKDWEGWFLNISGGYNVSKISAQVNSLSCLEGYTDYGSATQCRKKEYATPTCSDGETLLSNGTCQKELDEDYSYYTYECPTDKNIKGDSWELTVDNTPPGCKDDTFGNCLSIERQTGVCKRQKLTCPSGYGTCTENSEGNYQCNRSGCEEGKAPCFGKICDYTLNDKVTYCENKSCPNTEGVYTDDEGNCKKLACPDNTYEFNNTCIEKD